MTSTRVINVSLRDLGTEALNSLLTYSPTVFAALGFKHCTAAAPSITFAVTAGLVNSDEPYSCRQDKKSDLLAFRILPYSEIDGG